AMRIDDRLGDGKPETCALAAALSRRVGTIKPVEELRQVLGRYRFARVLDVDAHFAVVRRKDNAYGTARGRMPNGIRENVPERALQHQPIAFDLDRRVSVNVERDTALVGPALVVVAKGAHFLRKIHRTHVGDARSAIGLG